MRLALPVHRLWLPSLEPISNSITKTTSTKKKKTKENRFWVNIHIFTKDFSNNALNFGEFVDSNTVIIPEKRRYPTAHQRNGTILERMTASFIPRERGGSLTAKQLQHRNVSVNGVASYDFSRPLYGRIWLVQKFKLRRGQVQVRFSFLKKK